MITLALDTSTKKTHIALLVEDGGSKEDSCVLTDVLTVNDFDSHNELLAYSVHSILAKNKIIPTQIDQIVFGNGPGSFTGLRIGASFVVGFISALQKRSTLPKLKLLSSLHVFGVAALSSTNQKDVFVHADARRNEVYGLRLGRNFEILLPLDIYPEFQVGAFESRSVEDISSVEFLAGIRTILQEKMDFLTECVDLSQVFLDYLRPVQAKTIAERALVRG